MSIIADLTIALRGTTGDIDNALDRTDRKLGGFRNRVNSHGSAIQRAFSKALGGLGNLPGLGGISQSLAGIVTGLAGGFVGLATAVASAGAALVAFGFAQMGTLDRTAKMAEQLGLTYGALAGLQHGAALAGIDAETLNGSLRHLTQGLSEAGQGHAQHAAAVAKGTAAAHGIANGLASAGEGAGHASRALLQLGLNAADLNKLSTDKQLEQIADALKGVGNDGDKAAAAMQLFGREGGLRMLSMLKDGSKGLQGFRAEAQALGLVLSRDQVAKVEEANRAWVRMKASLTGVSNTMAVLIAPWVERVAGIVQRLFVGINAAIQTTTPYVSAIWDTVKGFFSMIGEMLSPVVEVFKSAFSSISDSLASWGITWDNAKKLFLETLWAMQYEFTHWRDMLTLGLDYVTLGFVSFGETIKFMFTDTLPQVFVSFGTWLGTFFKNLWANVSENLDQLWEYVKSGGTSGGDFRWHSLTEGFAKAMEEIAAKGERPLTDYEKELIERIKAKQGNLIKGVGDFIKDKWKDWNKVIPEDKAKGRAPSTVATPKKPAAVEAGSLEAFKIIAGDQKDKMWDLGNKQLGEARKHNRLLDRLLNRLKPVATGHARL